MHNKTHWDSNLYQSKHSYVFEYGSDLLKILDPKPGEKILDLACGTGQLTKQIASSAADVVGIDSSSEMIERAKANYPQLDFLVADARDFCPSKVDPGSFDAVFSNAALHWVKDRPEQVLKNINQALKPGARFVMEMGGKGNIEKIVNAIYEVLIVGNYKTKEELDYINPWFFPSLAGYSSILEKAGFRVSFASHFDRPTKLEGDDGIASWVKMYANCFFVDLDQKLTDELILEICKKLKGILYKDGAWFADYVRLRIVAYS